MQATAADKAGNTFTGSAVSFILDNTAPATASVTTPASGNSFRAATVPAAFGGSVADSVGGVGLNANSTTFTLQRSTDSEYWNGSAWQATIFYLTATNSATTGNTLVAWTNTATLPSWASQLDATYTVQATAANKAGDTFSGAVATFVLDNTVPATASVTTPVSGSQFRAATVPTSFSGSVADSAGGVGLNANSTTFTLERSTDGDYWTGSGWQGTAVNLAATNSATTGGMAATWTDSATLPTWATQTDAVYTIQATATNSVGSTFSGGAVSFQLDDTPPTTATVTAPVAGSTLRAVNVPAIFSGSVADNAGGVGLNANSTTFTLQRSTDGDYWNGTRPGRHAAFSLAATNSVTTSNAVATWTSNATLPTWASQPDATYTIQVTAIDQVGNAFAGSAVSFALDDTLPTVTLNPVVSPTSSTAPTFSGTAANAAVDLGTITINVYSGSSAIGTPFETFTTSASGGSYSAPAASALTPDGTYTAQAAQSDIAGNTGFSGATTFVVDTAAPVITQPGYINIANRSAFAVTGTAEPNSNISLTVSDNSGHSVMGTATTNGSGNWTVSALNLTSLVDGTGNINYNVTSTDPVTLIAIPGATVTGSKLTVAPTPPVITQPPTISLGNQGSFSVSGTAQANTTINLSVTDGATTVTGTAPTSGGVWTVSNLNLIALQNGSILFSATATDVAGNVSTTGFAFGTKDTVSAAPTITPPGDISPAFEFSFSVSGSSAANTANISLTITDGSTTDNAPLVSSDNFGNWIVTGLDVSMLHDGVNNITYSATSPVSGASVSTVTGSKDTTVPTTAAPGRRRRAGIFSRPCRGPLEFQRQRGGQQRRRRPECERHHLHPAAQHGRLLLERLGLADGPLQPGRDQQCHHWEHRGALGQQCHAAHLVGAARRCLHRAGHRHRQGRQRFHWHCGQLHAGRHGAHDGLGDVAFDRQPLPGASRAGGLQRQRRRQWRRRRPVRQQHHLHPRAQHRRRLLEWLELAGDRFQPGRQQ